MKTGIGRTMVSIAAAAVMLTAPAWAASGKGGWRDFAGTHIGDNMSYTTKYEDTLITIARNFNLGFVELRAANPYVDPWMPGEGVEMTLPAMFLLPPGPRKGVVINLPEMRMYAYMKSGKPPESYPLGIGREGLQTPSGTTTVVRKAEGPIWRPTPRMRSEDKTLPAEVHPGPDNPMGTHALYLGWPQYAIHGTNKPYGIGRRSSSGCLRMYPEDIIKAYNMMPVGTSVTVINEPVKAAWVGNRFYVEAHPTIEQADRMEQQGGLPGYQLSEDEMKVIADAAGADAHLIDWTILRQVIRERNGMPIAVATRPKTEEKAEAETAERI